MRAHVLGLAIVLGAGSALSSGCGQPGGGGEASATPPPPQHAAPSAEELAFLGPVKEGEVIEGYSIEKVSGVVDGALHLELAKGELRAKVDIALVKDGPLAPATFGDYGVYYRPGIDGGDAQRLAGAIAQKLEASGKKPPPKGMGALKVQKLL